MHGMADRLGVSDDALPVNAAPGSDDTHNIQRKAVKNEELDGFLSRLGPRGYDEIKDRSHIGVSSFDTPLAVTEAIMRILKEPPHKKEVFMEVVETIGTEQALTLLFQTEDLQEAGGLLTQDETRPRLVGGVYLFLNRKFKADHPNKVTDVKVTDVSVQRDVMKRQWHAKKARQKRWAAERRPNFPDTELPN